MFSYYLHDKVRSAHEDDARKDRALVGMRCVVDDRKRRQLPLRLALPEIDDFGFRV